MPQNPSKDEPVKEPPVEVIPTETKQPQPAAEVELDTTGKPVSRSQDTSVSAEEFKKMQARLEYQSRQFERAQRELVEKMEELRRPAPVINPTEKPENDDLYGLNKEYLNQIGQSDWTQPVKLMAEKIAEKKAEEKFKALMAEQEKIQIERQRQLTNAQILERERNWVLEQEPSLNDETSDQFRGLYATYNRMIQEDPSLVQNPRAPRLVYYEWKAETKKGEVAPDPEKERLKRVAAGVSPQGRSSSPQKTIRLTQDEVDFCKEKGISPAVYAQMKEANFKEGVSA
jgi:hypothetical protein